MPYTLSQHEWNVQLMIKYVLHTFSTRMEYTFSDEICLTHFSQHEEMKYVLHTFSTRMDHYNLYLNMSCIHTMHAFKLVASRVFIVESFQNIFRRCL